MFARSISKELIEATKSFFAVSLVGPRQSGKTTLLKYLFPSHRYLNLEDPDTLAIVQQDPRGFFQNKSDKWIIDEAQEYPELFSYLLGIIDNNKILGQFILSGSQNFYLMEKISQSLAGRIAILELLPLSINELKTNKTNTTIEHNTIWQLIYNGSYPGPNSQQTNINLWYKSYINTYIQRDIRQLVNIKDLNKFHLFLKLCAYRHGSIINYTEIGNACGITQKTVEHWLSILEVSFLIYKLQPYYRNFNKRLIKSPKLYFYDSGLVCHLLAFEDPEHVQLSQQRGALFEGLIISDVIKLITSQGKTPNIYFWNNNKGFEIDLLIEKANHLQVVEIKSTATFSTSMHKQLNQWHDLTSKEIESNLFIVYSGIDNKIIQNVRLLSFLELDELVNIL